MGAAEALEVPASLRSFHEEELVEYHDAALASSFCGEWRETSGDAQPLALTECVGYRVPLFLGGEDTTRNLDRADADIHWSVTAQLLRSAT